jgi:hypothetical protein
MCSIFGWFFEEGRGSHWGQFRQRRAYFERASVFIL